MSLPPFFSVFDHACMARAIQLARKGLYTTHPNPRVGCVIARNGEIVGAGWHERAGQAHAEVHALAMAGATAQGADVYVSLEPCSHFGRTPPCAEALVQAGVKRVVVAMADPNPQVAGRGLARLQQAGIDTASGLLAEEARRLNPGFISAMERQRPFVRVKMAMSLDGRTAMASGESVWITGAAARQDVQHWRAQAGAVLTGIGTVLMDKPSLNVRLSAVELGIRGEVRQPVRVILDSNLRLPPDSPLLQLAGEVVVYTCNPDPEKRMQLEQVGVRVRCFAGQQLPLPAVMTALVADGINEVHVEAGATVTGSLLAAGLVDELVIYMAPHLMGSAARALFDLPFVRMAERMQVQIRDIRAVGADWRILASVSS